MIVWINGTYGVGKSSVAKKLSEILGDKSEIIETDFYFKEFCKKKFFKVGGGFYPQNNKVFINDLSEIIESKENKNKIIIVPMTVTMEESKQGLIDYLSKKIELKHIILTADKEVIKDRINNDFNRAKDTSLYWLDSNIALLNRKFNNTKTINTTNKTVEEIANIIYNEIY